MHVNPHHNQLRNSLSVNGGLVLIGLVLATGKSGDLKVISGVKYTAYFFTTMNENSFLRTRRGNLHCNHLTRSVRQPN